MCKLGWLSLKELPWFVLLSFQLLLLLLLLLLLAPDAEAPQAKARP
jgi:hypothetical protein